MKALFIGGTGTISMAITKKLALDPNYQVYLINRGNRTKDIPENVILLKGDINDEAAIKDLIAGLSFDVVCDFIGFNLADVERDYRLFKDITKQYIYISSASAYNKPSRSYLVNEGTSLANPYWEYSRKKALSERFLMDKYEKEGFPVTIVRPSHTYDERKIPLGVHGKNGSWQVVKRIMEDKPVIIHGDGSSLWTMTFNEDFADGFIGLMANNHAIGEAFQITSDETLTWNQIYEAIADALGKELKAYYVTSSFLAATGPDYDFEGSLIGDKANSVVFDNQKLKRALPGFVCKTSFAKGVKRCIDFLLANPEYQREDSDFDDYCDRVIAALEAAKEMVNTDNK